MAKKYFIQTFGCAMNQADSEKVHMVLLQSGFFRAGDIDEADLIIFNTCSVRQKGEDRVFGMLREIEKKNELRREKHQAEIISGITGCMVRKTGIAKKYLEDNITQNTQTDKVKIKRKKAKKIELLSDTQSILNCDDKLFPRSSELDFTFRIEETKYLPLLLTEIYGEKIGQEDKFDDYLKQTQQRENPSSANVIIQTGCDNYCSFCIVPYTRGSEISRSHEEIVTECQQAAADGATEITLLGQNVNSYGKQTKKSLWSDEASSWNTGEKKLKIGIDLDDTLFVVLGEELLQQYNHKFHDIIQMDDIDSFDCGGIQDLMDEYTLYEHENARNLEIHTGGEEIIKQLKSRGHRLYVITSRPPEAREHTDDILKKYFGENFCEKIIFIKDLGHDNKYKAANAHNLDIVIDDSPHHVLSYMDHFAGKICMFHQPWNASIEPDNSQLYRVHDWYEFSELLPKLTFTTPFRSLLQDIDSIEGIERIRFTSSNPHDMTRDILDAHFDLKNTCNYLHFALQSGNNAMLKKMNRRHSYEDFRDMVNYLRKKDPLFSISTDIIVGFSGETDAMFEDTIRAFKELVFDFAYIARYSVRPNTLAAKVMPDDIPDNLKAERWHILNNILLENIQVRNELMLGRVEEVMISGETDSQFSGRTRNFKEVFFEKSPDLSIGDRVGVKITQMNKYVLQGKRV